MYKTSETVGAPLPQNPCIDYPHQTDSKKTESRRVPLTSNDYQQKLEHLRWRLWQQEQLGV